MRVGNKRALRLEPAKTSPNVVGGHEMNRSGDGVNGATVSGGGAPGAPNKAAADYATVGGGIGNTVLKERGTISGGRENTAAGIAAVIAGGYSNQVAQSDGTIGGGYGNENKGYIATVAGGWANQANGKVATVGGGQNNSAQGAATTVAGGWQNNAVGNAATVAGGHSNTAEGNYASVGGGTNNVAAGNFAVIPGGSNNAASGDNAFAGDEGARAEHPGAFVWSDSQADSLASTGADQFIIQAKGNVGIDTNAPDQKLTVAGNVKAEQFIGDGSKLTGVLTAETTFAGDVIGQPGNLRVRPGAISADHLAPGVIDESLKRSPIANQLAAISRDAVTKGTVVNGDVVGTLDGLRLKPGVVAVDKLAPAVLEGMQIKPGSITAEQLAPGVVEGMKIKPASITAEHLDPKILEGMKIKPGSIAAEQLAPGVLEGMKIKPGSIGAASLDPALQKQLAGAGEGALTEETAFGGDVSGSSTNLQLRAGVVSAEKLAPKLLERAINQSPLAADVARLKRQTLDKNQVVAGEIVGPLTDLKIGDGAVTPKKLSPEIRAGLQALEEGSVRSDSPVGGDVEGTVAKGLKIRRGAITADKLAPDVIEQALNTSLVSSQMSKLQREVVTRDFVAGGDVVGTLDGLRVRPGSITPEKLSPQLLQELQSMAKPEKPKPIEFKGDVAGTAANLRLRPGSVSVDKLAPEVIDAVSKYNDLSVELAKVASTSLSSDAIFNGDVVGTADNLKLREGLIEQAIQQSEYARALAAKMDEMGKGDDRNLQILSAIESLKDSAMSNSTQFDGDLEGTAKQLRLKRNAVRTEHLAPGSVTRDKLNLLGSLNPTRAGVDGLGTSEARWKGLYVSDRIDYDKALTFTSGGVVKMVIDEQGDLSVDGLRLSGSEESPSVIGGHRANRVDAGAFGATIAGGGNVNQPNVVSSEYGSIAGGFGNHVTGFDSSIGGGQDNRAGGKASAIAGGFMNKADGLFPAVGGGAANIATANASVINGDFSNKVKGAYTVIPGNYQNYTTGDFSMAAGHRALAGHAGSFVWSDASPGDFSSAGRNQFAVRASGGTSIYSNPQGTTGVKLPAGSGSWAMLSDRNAKENMSEVNSEDVLEHLAKLPIYT